MEKEEFKTHKLFDLKRVTLMWSFDTFRTSKGYNNTNLQIIY